MRYTSHGLGRLAGAGLDTQNPIDTRLLVMNSKDAEKERSRMSPEIHQEVMQIFQRKREENQNRIMMEERKKEEERLEVLTSKYQRWLTELQQSAHSQTPSCELDKFKQEMQFPIFHPITGKRLTEVTEKDSNLLSYKEHVCRSPEVSQKDQTLKYMKGTPGFHVILPEGVLKKLTEQPFYSELTKDWNCETVPIGRALNQINIELEKSELRPAWIKGLTVGENSPFYDVTELSSFVENVNTVDAPVIVTGEGHRYCVETLRRLHAQGSFKCALTRHNLNNFLYQSIFLTGIVGFLTSQTEYVPSTRSVSGLGSHSQRPAAANFLAPK